MVTELELRDLKGHAQGLITIIETGQSDCGCAPSRDHSSLMYLAKLTCPSKTVCTGQMVHADLRKSPALILPSCGFNSLRTLRCPRERRLLRLLCQSLCLTEPVPTQPARGAPWEHQAGRREILRQQLQGRSDRGASFRGEKVLACLLLPHWSFLL